MGWFNGIVTFVLVWWTVLFAILPIGVQPIADPDQVTGWRGAPAQARMGRKVLWTTVAAAVIWGTIYLLVRSDWLSFRHGILAI